MEKANNNSQNILVEIVQSKIMAEKNTTSKSFVIPGAFHANPKDQITWKAIGTGARIIFPRRDLFNSKGFILKAGESKVKTVPANTKSNVYPYVVITDDGNIAVGGSFPIIIID